MARASGSVPTPGADEAVEVLTSRLLLTPTDPSATRRFYGEVLGLAVAREFGPPEHPGIVYFTGGGFLEVSGQAPSRPAPGIRLWLQVRDVHAEHERLSALGAAIRRPPVLEPWGLLEMWLEDPDGVPIVLVEIPADHPIRRDTRG
jgi:predicted enzyme related to lactoylglutathione lyase